MLLDGNSVFKIYHSLNVMASLLQSANGQPKQKKTHALSQYLHENALGLMARLTEPFNDTSIVRPPIEEQERCIKAMEEMIKIGKRHIRMARPQVSAAQ
jgi:serine/threonine-protein kinase ATR